MCVLLTHPPLPFKSSQPIRYLTFLDDVEGNIFNNYDDDILVEIGKVLLGIIIRYFVIP